jgi:hypothetical protein
LPSSQQLTFPLIGVLAFYFFVNRLFDSPIASFDSLVKSLTSLLDFPISFIEAVLIIRLICFFSRYFLNTLGLSPTHRTPGVLPECLMTRFIMTVTAVGIAAGSTGFTLLQYGWLPYTGTVYGSAAVALLFLVISAPLFFDSNIVSDSALVLLRVSLSVAPAASYSSGQITWWLRSTFALAAFLSLPYDLEALSCGARRSSTRLPAIGVLISAV